jgi:hypothetical protein
MWTEQPANSRMIKKSTGCSVHMKFHRGRPPLPQRPEGWGSWRLLSRWRCHKASLQAVARAIPKRAWWRHPFPIINFAQDGERARQGRCQAHLLLGEAGAPTQEGQGHWLWDAGMNTRVCIRKRRHSHESPTATKCHLPYVKVFWSPGTVGGPPWWTGPTSSRHGPGTGRRGGQPGHRRHRLGPSGTPGQRWGCRAASAAFCSAHQSRPEITPVWLPHNNRRFGRAGKMPPRSPRRPAGAPSAPPGPWRHAWPALGLQGSIGGILVCGVHPQRRHLDASSRSAGSSSG